MPFRPRGERLPQRPPPGSAGSAPGLVPIPLQVYCKRLGLGLGLVGWGLDSVYLGPTSWMNRTLVAVSGYCSVAQCRSRRFLNAFTVGAAVTSAGSWFHAATTRFAKNLIRGFRLLLLISSFRLCPLQGRRIRGFEGARAPPERGSAPSHCQKHPLKMKENLMKHRFEPISIKVMVVLTLILGLYLCKTAVIHHFALN